MGKTLRLVAELKAMADDRYTMRYAAICAGISLEKCAELAAEHEIAFRLETRDLSPARSAIR
jgi:alcohol dehydrogenase class IV